MKELQYSDARAVLADLHDQALQHLPTRIVRRRSRSTVLLSDEDLKSILARFVFTPEVLFESGGVAIWLPELAIWGRGDSFGAARDDLLAEIDQLLAVVSADSRMRHASNIVERLPWIYRLMEADGDAEREAILFAAPPEASSAHPKDDRVDVPVSAGA
jgi:hypothetical protein